MRVIRVVVKNSAQPTASTTWGRKLRTIIMVSREGHRLTDLLYRQQTQGSSIDAGSRSSNHPDLQLRPSSYGVPFSLNILVTKDTKAQVSASSRPGSLQGRNSSSWPATADQSAAPCRPR